MFRVIFIFGLILNVERVSSILSSTKSVFGLIARLNSLDVSSFQLYASRNPVSINGRNGERKRSEVDNKRRDSTRRANSPENKKAKETAQQREDDELFWRCVGEARKNALNPDKKSRKFDIISESKLFGVDPEQSNQVIDFDQYKDIKVTRVGPHANEVEPFDSFDKLCQDLPPFVRENIVRMRYKTPTPIQRYAVPLAMDARSDLMCSAQTGSGKTVGT